MRFGAHLSIQGGWPQVAGRAAQLGCEALQVFSRSPRGGKAKELDVGEVDEFKRLRAVSGVDPLAVHVPYFVNLAAEVDDKWEYSVEVLTQDLRRGLQLGAFLVVTHPGHSGADRSRSLPRVARALDRALAGAPDGVMLLLENTCGQGGELGATFEELSRIAALVGEGRRLGFCLDTAHAFAAGHDLASPGGLEACLGDMQRWVGLDRLRLLHLNDAVHALGSRRDRHAQIGEGRIGLDGFRRLVNHPSLVHLAGVLETPVDTDAGYAKDLQTLHTLRAGIAPHAGT